MPIYMNYEGIKGSVTSGKYKDWIELQTAHFSEYGHSYNTTTNRVRKADRLDVSEIVVTKQQDNSSPYLLQQAYDGAAKKVIIDFVEDPGQALYLRVELESTRIARYNNLGNGGDANAVLRETFSLSFTKINYNYTASAPMPKTK